MPEIRYRDNAFDYEHVARWAILLDYYFLVTTWKYRAVTYEMQDQSGCFEPHYLVSMGNSFRMVLEVHTDTPPPEIIKAYQQFLGSVPVDIVFGLGNFKGRGPKLYTLTEKPTIPQDIERDSISFADIWPESEDCIKIAREYRFDRPEAIPDIRSGAACKKNPLDYLRAYREEAGKDNEPGKDLPSTPKVIRRGRPEQTDEG